MYALPEHASRKLLRQHIIVAGMAKPRRTPRENLVANITGLMTLHGDTTVSLAAKCGIPQRTIYNILHSEQKVSVEQAELMAAAYGYSGWQIILPDLPSNPKTLDKLMAGYLAADADTRDIIDRLAKKAENGS